LLQVVTNIKIKFTILVITKTAQMRISKVSALLVITSIIFYFIGCNKPSDTDNPPNPPTPSLTVDKTALSVPFISSTDSITITSTEPWTLSIPATSPWINADKTSGIAGTNKVHLTFAANSNTSTRNTTLTVNSTGATLPSVSVNVSQDQPDVKITSFTSHAPGGAIITINGTGFSQILNENIVKINGVTATVNSASSTVLTVTVPLKVGSGRIQVNVNTKSDISINDFIYDWLGTVTIIAGGVEGYADGAGTSAQFSHPAGMDMDGAGNIYVADYANSKIRKISSVGTVTTLPGRIPAWNNPSGPNTDFGLPQDIAVDNVGNLFVAEVNSNAVSKISSTGTVSLIAGGMAAGYADGTGIAAQFYWPTGIEVDASGNLIVIEIANHKVRKVTQSGVVTTLAGSTQSYADGTGTAAQFNMPYNVVKDLQGNFLITDHYNNRIRKMTPAGVVTTFAGSGAWDSMDGDLLTASIYKPTDIAINASGNIYLCDGNSKIRWITPEGKVRTINTNISFNGPQGIVADNNDVIYISDYYNNRICKVTYQ
jgi:hypothetical protein